MDINTDNATKQETITEPLSPLCFKHRDNEMGITHYYRKEKNRVLHVNLQDDGGFGCNDLEASFIESRGRGDKITAKEFADALVELQNRIYN